MKKNILLSLLSLSFCLGANASDQEPRTKNNCCLEELNFYAKIFGGANFLQNTTINGNKASYETGYVASGALGFCWRYYGLRLEGEYAFRRNDIDKIHFNSQGFSKHGHFQTSSYMANLLWDFPLCAWGCKFWKLQPFIGAGIGADLQQMYSSNSLVHFSQKWTRFSWQAMTGLSYPIFHNTVLSVEYKFHEGGSHFYNHSVGVGLAYKFGFIRKCKRQTEQSKKKTSSIWSAVAQ